MLMIGCVVTIVSSVAGYGSAVALDVSIGGMIALVTGGCFTPAFLLGPCNGVVAQLMRDWRQRYADE